MARVMGVREFFKKALEVVGKTVVSRLALIAQLTTHYSLFNQTLSVNLGSGGGGKFVQSELEAPVKEIVQEFHLYQKKLPHRFRC